MEEGGELRPSAINGPETDKAWDGVLTLIENTSRIVERLSGKGRVTFRGDEFICDCSYHLTVSEGVTSADGQVAGLRTSTGELSGRKELANLWDQSETFTLKLKDGRLLDFVFVDASARIQGSSDFY